MKITKSKLKRIITEELQNILSEVDPTKVLDPVEMAKKRQADREARTSERLKKARLEGRARRLMKLLYPLTEKEEMEFNIRQNNDEGTLADSLFGFMFGSAAPAVFLYSTFHVTSGTGHPVIQHALCRNSTFGTDNCQWKNFADCLHDGVVVAQQVGVFLRRLARKA